MSEQPESGTECELCGDVVPDDEITLTSDSHPEGVNHKACEDCADYGGPGYRKAGTEERTEASVAKVHYASLERGELVRYLEPGDVIDLPADRVEVEVFDDAE